MARYDALSHDVQSTISYLARDKLWDTEKPYIADFPLDAIKGAKITNQIIQKHLATIHDVRGSQRTFTLEKNSFCFLKAKTSLTADTALENPKEYEKSYF